eukprot:27474-Eustigmatos_ZCMA.PRE.1
MKAHEQLPNSAGVVIRQNRPRLCRVGLCRVRLSHCTGIRVTAMMIRILLHYDTEEGKIPSGGASTHPYTVFANRPDVSTRDVNVTMFD